MVVAVRRRIASVCDGLENRGVVVRVVLSDREVPGALVLDLDVRADVSLVDIADDAHQLVLSDTAPDRTGALREIAETPDDPRSATGRDQEAFLDTSGTLEHLFVELAGRVIGEQLRAFGEVGDGHHERSPLVDGAPRWRVLDDAPTRRIDCRLDHHKVHLIVLDHIIHSEDLQTRLDLVRPFQRRLL